MINILSVLRKEAPDKLKKYHPEEDDTEKLNQAYSRAYIHLFLKVTFGLIDFEQREHFITDGTNDGGIDGYFINHENKTIFFIQSKFRTSKKNFEAKYMELEEILAMDTDRILEGEKDYENGIKYNGKILQLQREISSIEDIGRYRYQVILLANVNPKISTSKLKVLSGGLPVKIFDYEKCYIELLYPIVSGTYYNASDLNININLSNKNSGSKISYTVQTEFKDCEITVLFVPTSEVANILYKYKNSVLKFNPRSYLEISGKSVNNAIRETILNKSTNEFALFNNGITMLSDETYLNEKIGQKDRAQLTVKNPQIINGGQTAFTLSKVLQENLGNPEIFEGKEVLMKVITFLDDEINDSNKRRLIREISKATNQQSTVTNADKKSNDEIQIVIQKTLFEKFGIFYERKRGEFNDGIVQNYIQEYDVLERSLFTRLFSLAKGNIDNAVRRKRVFITTEFTQNDILSEEYLGKFIDIYKIYKEIVQLESKVVTRSKISSIMRRIQFSHIIRENLPENKNQEHIDISVEIAKRWGNFIDFAKIQPSNEEFVYFRKNRRGDLITKFKELNYMSSGNVKNDLKIYIDSKLHLNS